MFSCFVLGATALSAQEGYQQPPANIAAILNAPAPATADLSPDRRWVISTERDKDVKTLAQLAEPLLGLGGVKVRPKVDTRIENIGITRMTLRSVTAGIERTITPPAGGRISEVEWVRGPDNGGKLAYLSIDNGTMALHWYDAGAGTDVIVPTPARGKLANLRLTRDGRYVAFTIASEAALVLAIADTRLATARIVPGVIPSHTLIGSPSIGMEWTHGHAPLLVQTIPASRGELPGPRAVPAGPIVQESHGAGEPARTYANLLKAGTDEALFDFHLASQIVAVEVDGRVRLIGQPGIHSQVASSPDGRYLLVSTVHRPYSYQLPWTGFPRRTSVWTRDGNEVEVVIDTPLRGEAIGRDAVLDGKRNIDWRPDAPATLAWVEALDGGDPRKPASKRDRVSMLAAPFNAEPVVLAETEWRVQSTDWLVPQLALVTEASSRLARVRVWGVDPRGRAKSARLLWDRSAEDLYTDPGTFVRVEHSQEERTVPLRSNDGRSLYLTGIGAAPDGARPFLDRFYIATGKRQRLWQSSAPWFEKVLVSTSGIAGVLDADAKGLLLSRESPTQRPNIFAFVRGEGSSTQLTQMPAPSPWFADVKSELIRYRRNDGVDLSATLYLPADYDKVRDGPLPFFFWAYPQEFLTAAGASQNDSSPFQFKRPEVGRTNQHLVLLAHGYGVLDGATLPIVSQKGAEPNDSYVTQLVSGAQAAVDTIVAMGVADPKRIGVGGHSYGAFMAANLLAHSDLFRAGIAETGAYNRTLTPFGFQAEPRTYWQAREVYLAMSPFNFANQISEPILLIHGTSDSNPGTFPLQSERMFAALKGNGGQVRYVQLPLEDHVYSARESQGHVIWEMLTWLDRYVANADR